MIKKKLPCIWLIDDDRANNVLHRIIVEKTGIGEHIEPIEYASRAIECLSGRGDNCSSPNLIFLDINMPVMDGWEFLEEYTKVAGNATEKPIIVMLTSSPNPDDETRARTFPVVSGYKKKPLTKEMLEEIMLNYFREYVD